MEKQIQALNLVRTVASQEYKDRIPTATQTNLSKIMTTITDYPTTKNEFINVLTNKVGLTLFYNKVLENPLKLFHRGKLENGKSIEAIFTDIIEAKNFTEHFGTNTSEADDVLGKEDSNVKVEYYTENYRHKYKTTISPQQLNGAFTEKNGLQTLINSLLATPISSAEYDEMLMVQDVISTAKCPVTVVSSAVTNEVTGKELTKKVKTMVKKLKFPSNKYNNQGVVTYSKPEDLVFITTPEISAELDVDVLATAFNITKAELGVRVIEIPCFLKADGSENPDVLGRLVDKDFIQIWDTLVESRQMENPNSLYLNNFYHRWGLMAQCGFANAIEFNTKAPATV